MADEAFALSPISARAALPGEQDYDAIREAFMETSRGRWFLGEYAKRNRNADTTMVLDAVARIEQAMAAQKPEPPRNDTALREALAAIRGAVDEAAEKATATLAGLELAEKLTPINKGARIIKEISWRWREIGADGRICDLIDSQLTAIEASCAEIAGADSRAAALNAAFDLLRHKLDALAHGEQTSAKASVNGDAGRDVKVEPKVDSDLDITAGAAAAADAVAAPAAAIVPEPAAMFAADEAAAVVEAPATTAYAEPEPVTGTPLPEAAFVTPETEPVVTAAAAPERAADTRVQAEAAESSEQVREHDVAAQGLAAQDAPEQSLEIAEQAVANQEPAHALLPDQDLRDQDLGDQDLGDQDLTHEAALAQDEAVLERVAIEMGAPDDFVDDDFSNEDEEVHTTLPPVAVPSLARAAEPAPRLDVAPPPPPPQFLAEPAPPVAPEPSLGATLIANGILPRPKPQSDPLAAIRRMSQAEKIAFFS